MPQLIKVAGSKEGSMVRVRKRERGLVCSSLSLAVVFLLALLPVSFSALVVFTLLTFHFVCFVFRWVR